VGLAVVLLLLSTTTTTAGAESPVVVAGDPPLTEESIGRFTEFFEWAFDVQLTNEQDKTLRAYCVDAWTKKKASDMKDVADLVQQQVELARLPAEQRAVVRLQIEPQLLASMRAQPNEPMARWALAVYEASHRVLAPGTPPLTRQTSDAFVEALFFMAGAVAGQPLTPEPKVKADWARGLAAGYRELPAELKQQIAAMPLFVATMRLAWPTLPEPEKETYRKQWAEQLKPMLPAPAAAAKAPAGGKKSVAQAMAEQNRRHQAYMSTSSAMMDIYKVRFNAQANLGGNPYRYW
jgi:hypothetical protein